MNNNNNNDDFRNIPFRTPGIVMAPRWEEESEGTVTKPIPSKPLVSEPVIRPDGKELCKYLRSVRMELASANGIELEMKECDYKGPCAGTCPTCDAEIRFLNDKLSEIKEEERVYPTISMYEVKPEKKKRGFFGKKKD